MKYLKIIALVTLMVTSSACSPIVNARGHNIDEVDFKQIVPGQTGEDDIKALFGTPSAISNYGQQTWYYIADRKETVGMFAPEITDQRVYAVHFTPQHTVENIVAFTKDDSKPVEYVGKTTPTEGNEITIMQQLFGNFGRFNTPTRAITPSTVTH